ncbi:uncharacterized protein LOC114786111 [Denticeps clupeoides]|uniref:uncharacterized protein LOC114786111 n=1 Tax=Denticeps clupeoides TaxID=299321 RepID=UPI0010A36F59|nr:uncharacterized protein LOC114786111 [Denticeps clupeoides]
MSKRKISLSICVSFVLLKVFTSIGAFKWFSLSNLSFRRSSLVKSEKSQAKDEPTLSETSVDDMYMRERTHSYVRSNENYTHVGTMPRLFTKRKDKSNKSSKNTPGESGSGVGMRRMGDNVPSSPLLSVLSSQATPSLQETTVGDAGLQNPGGGSDGACSGRVVATPTEMEPTCRSPYRPCLSAAAIPCGPNKNSDSGILGIPDAFIKDKAPPPKTPYQMVLPMKRVHQPDRRLGQKTEESQANPEKMSPEIEPGNSHMECPEVQGEYVHGVGGVRRQSTGASLPPSALPHPLRSSESDEVILPARRERARSAGAGLG